MVRPEPFRALLEEAYRAEGKPAPRAEAASAPLDRRLDQIALAGVTPARGTRAPASVHQLRSDLRADLRSDGRSELRHESALGSAVAPPVNNTSSTQQLLDALDVTDRMDRPFHTQSLPSRESVAVAIGAPRAPLKSVAAAVGDAPTPLNLPRPPPLPKKGAALKAAPAPVVVPPIAAPVAREADRAPPPRIAQFLDDNTMPGLRESSSSGSGKMADLYRLQLEFEDTPARPLPRNASLPPLPTADAEATRPVNMDALRALDAAMRPAYAAPEGLVSFESADLHRLDLRDLEDGDGIADLDMLARAMGLRGVSDVSIPSLEGFAVADDAELDEGPTLAPLSPLLSDSGITGRRARVLEALADGAESVFPAREGEDLDETRPALLAQRAVTPVIVKIPSRPRVTAENRERARRLYLSAVDALAKADRGGAVGHLRLAIELDDGNPLYPELLKQLEKQMSQPPQAPRTQAQRDASRRDASKSAEGAALMVASGSGKLRRPQEFVRYRHD